MQLKEAKNNAKNKLLNYLIASDQALKELEKKTGSEHQFLIVVIIKNHL